VTTPKCSRGESTIDSYVRTLKVNIGGFDWEMQLILIGNDYIPVSNIYLKGI